MSPEAKDIHLAVRTPDFDGGVFSIEFLTNNPKGLELKTDKNLARFNSESPYFLNDNDKAKLKGSYPGQLRFTGGNAAQLALDNLRSLPEDASEEIRLQAAQDYEAARKEYLSRYPTGIGVRNVRREDDTVIIDTKPVLFPVYRSLASDSRPEAIEFAATSAVAMALTTNDDQLIIVHRNPKNDPYGDMPGASVGGYAEAETEKNNTKSDGVKLQPVTTETIKDNITREMNEELGVETSDISELAFTGLALEKTQVHHEFLFYGKLNLTLDEVKKKAEEERDMHPEEFAEKFVGIPANPESIFKLLTQLDTPLPPTHLAVFAAAGYLMALQRDGLEKAKEYKENLETGIKANNERIDGMVRKYYSENPEVFNQLTERQSKKLDIALGDFLKRNPDASQEKQEEFKQSFVTNQPQRDPNGYNAYFIPTEQGLPDFETAMKKVGLI